MLAPYQEPLSPAAVSHLLRRTHFGAAYEARVVRYGQHAAPLVERILETARFAPLPDPPAWADDAPPPPEAPVEEHEAYATLNASRAEELRMAWLEAMGTGGLRERLTLFWHNHFVTELESYRLAPFAYRYLTTLRTHALGNFRDFVHAIGLDPAMLRYLNGVQNVAGAPNGNYARELLELFTMGPEDPDGQPNYSQQDIEEIARALTGWVIDERSLSVAFVPERHDAGEKTIFGRTGAWGYDDVIDLLFAERRDEIAVFIAGKLYREFVYAEADAAVVADLAGVLLDADFALAPAVEVLLASEAFFDERVRGARIKSPTDLLVGLMIELDTGFALPAIPFDQLHYERLGQILLSPPNVAGWPGHHTWISTESYAARARFGSLMVHVLGRADRLVPITLAQRLHNPNEPLAVFDLPTALARYFLSTPVEAADVITPANGLGGDLVNFPIPEEITDAPDYVLKLATVFLDGIPWYEWNLYADGAGAVIIRYIQALFQMPDIQLA